MDRHAIPPSERLTIVSYQILQCLRQIRTDLDVDLDIASTPSPLGPTPVPFPNTSKIGVPLQTMFGADGSLTSANVIENIPCPRSGCTAVYELSRKIVRKKMFL